MLDGVPGTASGDSSGIAASPAQAGGSEYLLCECCRLRCAVALGELREVVRALPPAVPLPFSPAWLLGVFALRTELVGLVDPAPLLLGALGEPALSAAAGETFPELTATLIAGDDEHLLGLAVSRLGAIAAITAGQIGSTLPPGTPPVAASLVRGWYHPGRGEPPYAVLNMPALVSALVEALSEKAPYE